MKKRTFFLLTTAILIFGFVLHIISVSNNNFFFTVDQGRDATYVREILNYHKIFLSGPETTIRGIYTGPLWYYFLALGYFILGGNPLGGVIICILLNLAATLVVITWARKKIGELESLVLGLALQFNWGFYYTSLWAFNPFPLVFLSILFLILLTKFLKGKRAYYFLALIPVILAFNTEIAGAIVFLLIYIAVGLFGYYRKILSLKAYLIFAFVIPAVGIAKIVYEALTTFLKSGSVLGASTGLGVISSTNFKGIYEQFGKILSDAIIPENLILSLGVIFLTIFLLILSKTRPKKSVLTFFSLTIVITVISYLFFASNKGYREWHTVYLTPLIFISILLFVLSLPKKIGLFILIFIMFFQVKNFYFKYTDYLRPSGNSSLFSNQIKVMDAIYKTSEGNGFDVYTYTNTFYDYSYQYLFSWYGKNKYGFYPCSYSNFPYSLKSLYIVGYEHYTEPKLGCDKLRYLIIESDTNGEKNKDWIKEFRLETRLLETIEVGNTKIEKRAVRTD
ncbi:MAG TPA: hypothetical protein VF185_01740 [Patescibacteria group bacterium]